MGLHQIIYTSCRRGINGVNDGQQVFSYDAGFQEADNDGVKGMFGYQLPALPRGVVMSEELVPSMPKSFQYRKLPSGSCALGLSTYLGRDYMGGDGRFGNHLSHVVVADHPRELGGYPCEFYGGGLLRDHMEFEEVNNPERPDYLPEPAAEKGYVVDLDAVADFLAVDDRIEILKDMLWAVLRFETDRKRLVICDEPENIPLWIAAIEYTLPLETAMDINFNTYEFDPSLSSSRICGVLREGTQYRPENRHQHYAFDFYENDFPQFEKDEEFCSFIDTALSFSYESLEDFHRFLEEGYTYRKADLGLCAAYRLYTLLSDGMAGIGKAGLEEALAFAKEYALPETKAKITESLLGQNDYLLAAPEEEFLCVLEYLAGELDQLAPGCLPRVKGLVVDRVLAEFVQSPEEEEFSGLYGRVERLCQERFSVAAELMEPASRGKLLAAMKQDPAPWKIAFVVRMAAAYARDRRLPVSELSPEGDLGQTLCGLVQTVYAAKPQNGFPLVCLILDEFGRDGHYMVNMVLNLEGILLDLPHGQQEVDSLWRYFAQKLERAGDEELRSVCKELGDSCRYDQAYSLYAQAMARANDFDRAHGLFRTYSGFFQAGSQDYLEKLFRSYYKRLGAFRGDRALAGKAELLHTLYAQRRVEPFSQELAEEVANAVPLSKPSPAQENWLKDAFGYLNDVLRAPLPDRLVLLCMGMLVEKCRTPMELTQSLMGLESRGIQGRLAPRMEQEAEAYIAWVLPLAFPSCPSRREMVCFAKALGPNETAMRVLFREWAKLCMKQGKGDRDCRMLCDFLSTVFECAEPYPSVLAEVGRVLGKLNKQRSAELDAAMVRAFRKDAAALGLWDQMRQSADASGSFREGISNGLNNFTNLFKRKQ